MFESKPVLMLWASMKVSTFWTEMGGLEGASEEKFLSEKVGLYGFIRSVNLSAEMGRGSAQ